MKVQLLALGETPPLGIGVIRFFSQNPHVTFLVRGFVRNSRGEVLCKKGKPLFKESGYSSLVEIIREPIVYIRITGTVNIRRFIYQVLRRAEEYGISYGKIIFK